MQSLFFNGSLGAQFTLKEAVESVIAFMQEDLSHRYRIVIGTDSENDHLTTSSDFVTAIVVHRVGNGGRYFWRRMRLKQFPALRDRIIQEVLFSLSAAEEILTALKKYNAPSFHFEIHADIGENGQTRAMIQEVVGMIRAYNFEAKTKPASYAATKVADRHI